MSVFKGAGVAIVTPFTEDGIDYSTFEKLIEFQIQEGIDAIIVCGTTGEPSTMTNEEKEAVIEFAVKKVNNRVPVIAGTGGNNTVEVIKASKRAEELGADALLIVTPYYNKATQLGLISHYAAINDAVNIPIIVYNVPSRTGVNVLPQTMNELSNLNNIVAIKEASGDISQITETCRLCKDKIDIYSGNDDHILPVLSVGGIGVISVVANIAPKDTRELVIKLLEGDLKRSMELQLKLKPLVDALFIEVNPIPVKAALKLLGYNTSLMRLPLTVMTEKNQQILNQKMQEYGFKITV